MIECRFGNSLRFGYTIDNTIGVPNRWSNEGEIGNPITIIRNGQVDINDDENYNHVLEDIDGDDSSIYLCSNQQISNFTPASFNQLSFGANLVVENKEEPVINNNELSEDLEEDPIMYSPYPLPPEELQENELSQIKETEDPYYDISDTEEQIILPDSLDIDLPNNLTDSVDFE